MHAGYLRVSLFLVVCAFVFGGCQKYAKVPGLALEETNPPATQGGSAVIKDGTAYYLSALDSFAYEAQIPSFSEIWTFNTSTLQWKMESALGVIPPRRSGYCASRYKSGAYMFGGYSTSFTSLNDMYMIHLDTLTWGEITPKSILKPTPRSLMSCAVVGSQFYLMGGRDFGLYADFWSFDIELETWEIVISGQDTLSYVPVLSLTQMAVYKDSLVFVSGCDISYTFNSKIWIYHTALKLWEEPLELEGVPQVYSGSATVAGSKLIVHGGYYIEHLDPYQNAVLVVDLDTIKAGSVSSDFIVFTNPDYMSSYPIINPSARAFSAIIAQNNLVYIIGGGGLCLQNDIWVFDTEKKEWIDSSLSRYPLGRSKAHAVTISNDTFAMFGGETCQGRKQPINDLWTYHPSTSKWLRLSQESICLVSQYDCAPSVLHGAFGYYKGVLYLVGGLFDGNILPISRQFSLERLEWNILKIEAEFSSSFAVRYFSANLIIGPEWLVWGGMNSDGSYVGDEILIFNMESMEGNPIENTRNTPYARSHPNGLEIDGSFCFVDTYFSDTFDGNRQVWCWKKENNIWTHYCDLSYTIPDQPIVLGFDVNIFLYGGYDQQGRPEDTFWAHLASKDTWVLLQNQIQQPPGLASGKGIIQSGSIFMIGGEELKIYSSGYSNSVYSAKLDRLWCRDTTYITSDDGFATDGSGQFQYFPNTNCRWNVSKSNYFIIEYVKISKGGSLMLKKATDCDKDITYEGVTHDGNISLYGAKSGAVVRIPSYKAIIEFVVSSEGIPDDGFSIKLLNCKEGFSARMDGCVCDAEHYVNFRGDCISCPLGTIQPLENQDHCSEQVDATPVIPEISDIKQGQTVELTIELPPIIFASACVIGSDVYVIGGSTSSDLSALENYISMEVAYVANSPVESKWRRVNIEGPTPARRVQSCLIGIDGIGILIGGRTSYQDNRVYFLDTAKKQWVGKGELPNTMTGPSCARIKEDIYVYGGKMYDGDFLSKLFQYSPVSDEWNEIAIDGFQRHILFGSVVSVGNKIFLFGGTEGSKDNNYLYEIDIDERKYRGHTEVLLDECISCDEENGRCKFGRQLFAFGTYQNELHIYGGLRQGEALGDISVIELDSSRIIHRENYGLNGPSFPLSNPPPKYGATFVMFESRLMLIGGSTANNIVSNDVWTWDSALRMWSDASIARSPIHRTEPGVAKYDEQSFLIFGDQLNISMRFYSMTFGNTLLVGLHFKSSGKWQRLFSESSVLGPSGRAAAMISVNKQSMYLFGGRTDVGVTDPNLWVFDLNTFDWTKVDLDNQLLSHQRPHRRLGIQAIVVDQKIWMWGGQIVTGAKNIEFYSAALVLDKGLSKLHAAEINDAIPLRRSYHSMCGLGDDSFVMFGGRGFSSNVLNDTWIYNTTTRSWSQVQYKSWSTTPSMMSHICGMFDTYTIFKGSDSTTGKEIGFMMQHDFQRQTPVYNDNSVIGYTSMYKQGGISMEGLVVSFGGTNGYSITNQVVAYKPGFCSNKPASVNSNIKGTVFDDGSGSGMYLEGTNCTWVLPTATHIIINQNIRKQDRIRVTSLLDGSYIRPNEISTREDDSTKITYVSTSGFMIQFISNITNTNNKVKNVPCENCEGFSVTHASCPLHSFFDEFRSECVCDSGYSLDNSQCRKDSSLSEINSISIIGGSLGGIFITIIISVFIYRKRLVSKIKVAEKKHLGIIDPNELTYGQLLGRGAFGEVYKGEWRGTEVAIKKLIGNNLSIDQMDSFKREISIMVELRHPNIVLYMGACFETENPCLVCELMHQGSLYDVLHQERAIPYVQQLSFMLDISKGMKYLHMSNPPMLHRDLKSLNILVDDRFRLKVSDFGLTTIQGGNEFQEQIGSLLWLAPEVIEGKEYAMCADVYSFGIIAWEIMSREEPYTEIENVFSVTGQVLINGLRPTMPENVPQDIQNIIKDLWHQDPLQRPTFQEASKRLNNLLESSRNSTNFSFVDVEKEKVLPSGNVSVVCTRVSHSERLWDDIPEVMAESVVMFSEKMKKINQKHRGYISQNDEENFVIVFQNTFDAIQFCSEVQWEMNWLGWPAELQFHELCKPTAEGDLKGLRIQIGVDYGICSQRNDNSRIGYQYSGKCVSGAMKLSRISQGGQILVSENVYHDLSDKMDLLKVENIVRSLQLKGGNRQQIYEVCPKKLAKRASYFEQLQIQSVVTSDQNEKKEFGDDGQILNTPSLLFHKPGEYSSKGTTKKSFPINESGATSKNVEEDYEERPKLKVKKEWEIDFKELVMEKKELGSGSFGSVFCAEFKGRRVAAKKIGTGNLIRDQTYIAFRCEVALLRRLKHPNIVEFIGASTERPNLYIIMEIVEPGSLRSILQNMNVKITPIEKKRITDGIISGMAYLHSLDPIVLHRDLKSANVLVNDKSESKICDFGLARIRENNRTMTKCGTVAYQAPEVMKGKRYNEKADVYSFGILLWEIETRETPYRGRDMLVLQSGVIEGLRPEIRSDMDSSTVEIMKRCWNPNPELRPNFRDLMSANSNEGDIEIINA